MGMIKIKAYHVVKPAEPTWEGIQPLSELDQIGVITHTPLSYIYNKPSKDSLYSSKHDIIDTLKLSLSRALVSFHPLAGRLRWLAGGRLRLECNALGVELIEAESRKRGLSDHILENVDHINIARLPMLISFEERKKKTMATTLLLTKSQVDRLKKDANREINEHDDDEHNIGPRRRPCGRFEVVAAHAWRCACKARGHKNDQMTALCFSVDSCRRMNPPLPPRYFGNAIVDMVASSHAGELISSPLSHACRRIRAETEKVTNDYVWSMIKFLETQKTLSKYQDRAALGGTEGVFYGNPNLGIASWLSLPIRGLDFGWGKEIHMGPATHDFDGDIMILPDYNDEDGSIMVVVGLQVVHMEKFKKYFYEDIY